MPQQNSKQTYIKNWLQLINETGSESPDKILEHVLNKPVKPNTKANLLNSIISLVRMKPTLVKDISKFEQARNKIQAEIRAMNKEDNFNDKQRDISNKVKWSDIETMHAQLKDGKEHNLEDYILLSLMIPPLRNDLQDIKICTNKKDLTKLNCLFLNGNKSILRINQHKTTSRGGKPIIRELDEELTNDIKQLISDGRSHLFVNRFKQPYKQSTFTHRVESMFKKHIGIPIGSTMLRKIWHTANTKDDLEKIAELEAKVEKTANNMGHSINVVKSHYVDNTK